jgi:protease-4
MVYTGRQALDLGLVDELGNLRVAIDVAKDLAGISGEAKIIRPHRPQPFSLTSWLQNAAQSLGVIDRLECPLQYRMSLVP